MAALPTLRQPPTRQLNNSQTAHTATNQEEDMKTCFIFIFLIVTANFASATTQTSIGQDKPMQIYIQSWVQSENTICYEAWPDDNNYHVSWTCFDNRNFNLNSPGSASTITHEHDVDPGISDVTYDDYAIATWPATYDGIDIQTEYVNGNLQSAETNEYIGSADFIYGFPFECGNINLSGGGTDVYAGNWSTSENQAQKFVLKMRTGGKAISKLRNLISLPVSATSMSPTVGPYAYYGILSFSNNAIASTNIQISSYGNLNANGVKYLVLPDNADVDVTPYVAGVDYYSFSFSSIQKYHSYFEVFVEQPNPGTTYDYLDSDTTGHAFWQFKTDAPADALQYLSPSLTTFVNTSWGFYPHGANCGLIGRLQNDGSSPWDVKRVFYIGFNDLISGLQFTRGISNAPPIYCFAAYGYSCVGATTDAGGSVGITLPTWWNPWNWTPQNFGAAVALKFPGPLDDETPRYSN
jgi:hypothetical protein